eukprot:414219_1
MFIIYAKKNIAATSFELFEQSRDIASRMGNENNEKQMAIADKNQTDDRVSVIRLYLNNAVIMNHKKIFNTPGVPTLDLNLRWFTIFNDTLSHKIKKGEMGSVASRYKSVWKGSFTGWKEWEYNSKQMVVKKKVKAGYCVEDLIRMGCVPTEITEYKIMNNIQMNICALVSGDGLYLNITDGMNEYAENKCGYKIIHKELTGPEHHDDCHVNGNAYTSAVDNITKNCHVFFCQTTTMLSGPKCAKFKQEQEKKLDDKLNYSRAPPQRYLPHVDDMITPFKILKMADWTKLNGWRLPEIIVEKLAFKDLLNDVFSPSIKIFQRTQNYRGYREIADKKSHSLITIYNESHIKFQIMRQQFEQYKFLELLNDFIEDNTQE